MRQYLDLLKQVKDQGVDRPDRTGTGTRSIFGTQMRFDLSKGFPAITTKKLAWKAVVSELIWFIEGSGDERRLREILHGDRNSEKGTIWTANAEAGYWKHKAKFDGDLGRIYGVQWRDWSTFNQVLGASRDGQDIYVKGQPVDQLLNLIEGLKNDPYGRRHIITAWNPGELDQMGLPPCHYVAQFYVANGKLSCQMNQRSGDSFLGIPFNIASYALFTHMIAQVCGYSVGDFIHVIGDTHLYHNHFDAVDEQLTREPLALPTLWLNPEVNDITKFTMDDIKLDGYQSQGPIKAPMAV